MPVIIAIAGNLGSGKTTLAKLVANSFQWIYIPRRHPELGYLKDLFKDPNRWSFEAQISFLVNKAWDIRQALSENNNIVIDRSIYEDIEIFAQYFYVEKKLSERAYSTYSQVAQLLLQTLPSPHLLIYCYTPPAISEARIRSRGYRKFEKLYPPKHIEKLFNLYEKWIKEYSLSPVAILDTTKFDIRSPQIAKQVLEDILRLFKDLKSNSFIQTTLFTSFSTTSTNRLQVLKLEKRPHTISYPESQVLEKIKQSLQKFKISKIRTRPVVYVAAPFTEVSSDFEEKKNEKLQHSLSFLERPHGIIGPGRYRKILLLITKTFKKLGLYPILPHKDINRWGYKLLTPEQVAELCRKEVMNADLFFGLFSRSLGVHFEAGIAVALNKPMIIVQVEELGSSFFAKGMSSYKNVFTIEVKKMEEIPNRLFSLDVLYFLQRHHLIE